MAKASGGSPAQSAALVLPFENYLLISLPIMERIKLTKREKNVLRMLRDGNSEALSEFDASSVENLARLGLVRRAGVEGGGFDDARLTNMGKEYFNDNPRLANPIDWKWVVTTAIAAIIAICAVIALFACAKLI